jgi:glycerate kinase
MRIKLYDDYTGTRHNSACYIHFIIYSFVNILVAPDKFKGSLTAKEVCAAVESGLLKIDSALSIKLIPMADGGEGTCELLTDHSKGSMISAEVSDPLFRKITASYGISGDGSTAFIEMASASGLALLSKEERNPLKTSTYGTGELIADAITRGVNKIILTIGGSATNDAGLGMAAALGVKFLNQENETLAPIGENLVHLRKFQFDKFFLNTIRKSPSLFCAMWITNSTENMARPMCMHPKKVPMKKPCN